MDSYCLTLINKNYETYYRSARIRFSTSLEQWFCTVCISVLIYLHLAPSISFFLIISRSILVFLGLSRAISCYLCQSLPICANLCQFQAISDNLLAIYLVISDYLWPFLSVSVDLGLTRAISGNLKQSLAISWNLWLSVAILDYLKLFLESFKYQGAIRSRRDQAIAIWKFFSFLNFISTSYRGDLAPKNR